jgi:tetratricopeptide (TPR) repeat protein
MGIIYQNLNQFDNATKCYEKYLSNHPKQMEAYANLSFAYYKMGDYNNSISVNRKAIANVPENAFNPLVNIGKTYLKMQINDSALYYFGLAKQLNPTDPYVSQYIQQLSAPQK